MAETHDLPLAQMQPKQVHELMEPALRIQVLLAQCQAGMWRRNGYSLQNQVSGFTALDFTHFFNNA